MDTFKFYSKNGFSKKTKFDFQILAFFEIEKFQICTFQI
jgi:hypothetical protein